MSAPDRWTIVSTAPFPPEAIRRFLPDGTEADVVVVEPRTEDGAVAAVADAHVVIGDFSFEYEEDLLSSSPRWARRR